MTNNIRDTRGARITAPMKAIKAYDEIGFEEGSKAPFTRAVIDEGLLKQSDELGSIAAIIYAWRFGRTTIGGAGRDTPIGQGGNHWLNGGTGGDTLQGGARNDTHVVDRSDDIVVEGAGADTDTVLVTNAMDRYFLAPNVAAADTTPRDQAAIVPPAADVPVDNPLVENFSADLPTDVSDITLWDQSDGSILMTWSTREELDGRTFFRYFVRRVDPTGATIGDEQVEITVPGAPAIEPPGVRLLGIDDAGVAAVTWFATGRDATMITWLDATGGEIVRNLELERSQSSVINGFERSIIIETGGAIGYEDGLVLYVKASGDWIYSEGLETFQSSQQLFLAGSDQKDDKYITSWSSFQFSFARSTPGYPEYTYVATGNGNGDLAFKFGWNEAGNAMFARDQSLYAYSRTEVYKSDFRGEKTTDSRSTAITIETSDGQSQPADVIYDRIGRVSSNYSDYDDMVRDTEVLSEGNYAVSYYHDFPGDEPNLELTVFYHEGQKSAIVGKASTIQAVGNDRYLVNFFLDYTAQIYDARGAPIGDAIVYAPGTQFLIRGDGTLLTYRIEDDGVQGQSTANPEVVVTTAIGDFNDNDGDGDLDYSGIIYVGMEEGEERSLRLEGGTYELTDDELKVAGATVFANIGDDTGSAIFKGGFSVDLHTGEVEKVEEDPLDDENRFNIAGLVPKVSSFSVTTDGAAFSVGLILPDTFFGASEIKLESPNSLLLTSAGARLSGGELELGDLGDKELDFFGLFAVESKDIKLKYDAVEDEMSFEGELALKSPLIDGLLGTDDIALTLKELKLKDGKFSLTTELTAEEWSLGPISLSGIKLGVEIEENEVKKVEGEFKVELPFAQLGGVGFAGTFLLLPAETEGQRLFLDKIGIELDTAIALPEGFFLDSVAGALDHMAPFPPEEEDTPTEFEGTIGIGWGPLLPDIEEIEEIGFEGIEDARILNIELGVKTDWTTKISASGKINLITDQLAKFEGEIEWDFEKNNFTFKGGYDYFGGTSKGTVSLKISELGITGLGTGTFTVPDFALFGPVAGLSLSGNTMIQVLADSDETNDFLAQWATVTLPLFGGASIVQTIGIRIDLNTATPSLILGSNAIPQGGEPPEEEENRGARLAAARADDATFAAAGDEDWLMLSASWANPASNVVTHVRAPDGRIIVEADYGANGITVIDLYSGPRGRTIVIADPDAGTWSFGVADGTGLGGVSYRGYSPNPGVSVTLDEAALAAGAASGTVTAGFTGADVGTVVSFWADTDGEGFDGFALGAVTLDAAAAAAGRVTYVFDATVLNGGSYHLYATADDHHGAPSLDYGAGTIAVAHAANDIAIDAVAVAQDALPGAVIGAFSATNVDEGETHVLTLSDDAGGRFAIVDGKLVVGAGAPFDAIATPEHDVTVVATTSRGLTYSETFTVTVAPLTTPGAVVAGTIEADTLVGGVRSDVFHAVSAGDIVIGQGGVDLLYLDGAQADFSITVDTTGAIAGPIRLNPLLPELIAAGLDVPRSPLDPAPPYLIIRDLRGDGSPIVASGIEWIQFRDTRIDVLIPVGPGGVYGPVASSDDYAMTTALAPSLVASAVQGVLLDDFDIDTPQLVASLVTAPAHGTLSLATDGGFTYTPDAGFVGIDSFVYRAFDGSNHSDATVTLTVSNGLTLKDDSGTDVLTGSNGNDVLTDTIDTVAIDARDGADRIILNYTTERTGTIAGGAGIDTLRAGGDVHLFTISGIEILETGGSTTTLTASQVAGLTTIRAGDDSISISLSLADAGTINAARKFDPAISASLSGSDGNDILIGTALGDYITGGSGTDILRGGSGSDALYGDAGSDVAQFAGRFADQRLERDGRGELYVIGAEGRDLVYEIETLRFIDGSYDVASETFTPFTPSTTAGDDVIVGADTDDILLGGAGDDRLEGRDGNDGLNGGTGVDVMIGGAGSDRYVVDHVGDVVTEGDAPGRDTVRSWVSYTLGDFVENLILIGAAAIDGTGNAMRNILIGNDAANHLDGSAGDDVLRGQGGTDTLSGGLGRDVLIGGAGADRYLFDAELNPISGDRIVGFDVALDLIVLDDAVFTALAPGSLSPASFGGRRDGLNALIMHHPESGVVFYDPDGLGELSPIAFARVDPGLVITAAHFLVI